jgi:hypothetical protein
MYKPNYNNINEDQFTLITFDIKLFKFQLSNK